MGRLAQRGVSVIFHNTLAASDYGLIDQQTLEPRPDYWAALLHHHHESDDLGRCVEPAERVGRLGHLPRLDCPG
jgi:hypothetical protein